MKKFLCAVIVIVLLMSLCTVVSAARKKSSDEMTADEIDAEIQRLQELKRSRSKKDKDVRLQVEVDHENKQRDDKIDNEDDEEDYDESEDYEDETSSGNRKWSRGIQEWRKGAKYQLTNWKFTKEQVTVELWKKGGKKAIETYTMRPYEYLGEDKNIPDFVFGYDINEGTQITVPEGCEIHCNPAEVDLNVKHLKRGGGVGFSAGRTIYFKTDSSRFTIFPYHAWPLD